MSQTQKPQINRPTTFVFFFFNDTATTEIYTLSLHDALPIWNFMKTPPLVQRQARSARTSCVMENWRRDRKSTRLNSSHSQIPYAVFCLKQELEGGLTDQSFDLTGSHYRQTST